jgi:hypothetical protein
MIQTLIIDNIDLITGKITAHNIRGTTYYLDFNNGIISRVPKIGDKVLVAIDGSMAYIIAFLSNYIPKQEIRNFNEIYYYIDDINFFRLMKNLFHISLDKSQIKLYDDNFILSSDKIEIHYKNGYIYQDGNNLIISCRFNEVFEGRIEINEDKIILSYKISEIENKIEISKNNEIKVIVLNGVSKIEINSQGVNVQSPSVIIESPNVSFPQVLNSQFNTEGNLSTFRNELKNILNQIISIFNTHQHPYTDNGSPLFTSPPLNQITISEEI